MLTSMLSCLFIIPFPKLKKCGIQMIYDDLYIPPQPEKNGTQVFSNKFRDTDAAHFICAHLAQMWLSHIKTINNEKNANNLISWKVLLLFVSEASRTSP